MQLDVQIPYKQASLGGLGPLMLQKCIYDFFALGVQLLLLPAASFKHQISQTKQVVLCDRMCSQQLESGFLSEGDFAKHVRKRLGCELANVPVFVAEQFHVEWVKVGKVLPQRI